MKTRLSFLFSVIAVLGFIFTASLALSNETVDMTGLWELDVKTASGGGNPTMDLKQEGAAITGNYNGAFGESPLTGTVDGDKFTINFNAAGIDIVYKGVVKGNTSEGTVGLGSYGDGTFTGKKK